MKQMDKMRTLAVVLAVAGILALAYGGFSYTEDTHEANIGSMHMSIDETRHVNIPVWAGVGMLLVGGLVFATGLKRT
jgi:drug/metabolite transporter (DMT)-like permease